MKIFDLFYLALLDVGFCLDPLIFKGSKVFNSKTGEQFYFKGLAYQPKQGVTFSPQDPLADEIGCKRDVKLFKELGINSIRVYEVDSSKNHDVCMKALEDAGIYVLLDLPTPGYSIVRGDPSWNDYLLSKYKLKVDAFYKYSNVAGFIVGNEIINSVDTTPASAFVKASLRDIKSYMKSKNINLPVGYADNDDEIIRSSLIKYFNCGDDPLAMADFYGINTYRWCGSSNYENSRYEDMIKPFKNYSVPYLLTEYGCNTISPRIFKEVASIYGSDMEDYTSGGFLFEYSEEPNNYGLVKVSFENPIVEKLQDFDAFKGALLKANPKGTRIDKYKPPVNKSDCPKTSEIWRSHSRLPPSPNVELCNCVSETSKCKLPNDYDPSNAVQSKVLSDKLSIICGKVDCSDVSINTTMGVYGIISGCSSVQKANWILNKNFEKEGYSKENCFIENMGLDLIISSQKDMKDCNISRIDVPNHNSLLGIENNDPRKDSYEEPISTIDSGEKIEKVSDKNGNSDGSKGNEIADSTCPTNSNVSKTVGNEQGTSSISYDDSSSIRMDSEIDDRDDLIRINRGNMYH
ncbi:Protein EPD1 [Smittium mucronatum]|uniref:1,3-beta-glucanosyltransferase n=1 Tax=Smittium mucronatum TaxID=133383 RepID=A0A1R0H1C2_9FUNG|nr:Protein EPD1 [Smittium mucronatum]